MPSLDGLFKDVSLWQQSTFGDGHPIGAARHMQEETKEVLLLLEQPRYDTVALAEELADVFFMWVQTLERSGIGIDGIRMAIIAKLAKNCARTWNKPDALGVVRHVKDGDHE